MKAVSLIKAIAVITASVFSVNALAWDKMVPAVGSCKTTAGTTTVYNNGLRASETAIVRCPLIKTVTPNAVTDVLAYLHRTSDATSYCHLVSIPPHGSFAVYGLDAPVSWGTGNKILYPSMPASQPSSSYMSLNCVLMTGDTLFGMRYLQAD